MRGSGLSTVRRRKPPRVTSRGGAQVVRTYGPGLGLVLVATFVSMAVSNILAVVSSLVLAIVIGVVMRNARLLPASTRPGTQWSTKRFLRAGVVLLGLQLSLPQVFSLEVGELVTILLTVVITFCLTWWIGVRIGVGRSLSMLIATGFSICGASAVAAMSAVSGEREMSEEDVATAITMVTLFGSLAILVLPMAQGFVGLDDHQMGVWIGSSVHEVAQVVAAASIVSTTALTVAVVVKLGRVVMLAPLIAIVGGLERLRAERNEPRERDASKRPPLVPLFVLGFLAMVLVRSSDLLPTVVLELAQVVTTFLLTAAMFGLGTGVHLATLVRTGGRAAVLGAISTLIAVLVSLAGIQWLT